MEIDVSAIAKTMVERYGFKVTEENMEIDRENYSYSLLDSLSALYDLESLVDNELNKMRN